MQGPRLSGHSPPCQKMKNRLLACNREHKHCKKLRMQKLVLQDGFQFSQMQLILVREEHSSEVENTLLGECKRHHNPCTRLREFHLETLGGIHFFLAKLPRNDRPGNQASWAPYHLEKLLVV